jgi:hypothetical protein
VRISSGTRVRCCHCKPRFKQAAYSSGQGLLGVRSQALVGAVLSNGAEVAVGGAFDTYGLGASAENPRIKEVIAESVVTEGNAFTAVTALNTPDLQSDQYRMGGRRSPYSSTCRVLFGTQGP